MSSKFGKQSILKPSSTNKFVYADERELFYASLLCYVLPQAPVLLPPLSTLPNDSDCAKRRKTSVSFKPIRLIQFAYDPPPTVGEGDAIGGNYDSPSKSSIRTPPSYSTVVVFDPTN